VNNSIAAAHPDDAFLRLRAANELPQIDRVRSLADRLAIIPLLASEPIGVEKLGGLTATASRTT
jgi:arsenite-transporting ATPase